MADIDEYKEVTFIYDTVSKKIGSVTVDAFLEEKHISKNTVSDLPVEAGYNISDNIYEEPDEIQITGFISCTKPSSGDMSLVSALNSKEALHKEMKDKIIQANQELKKLKKDKKPITIVTGLDVYEDMVITSYEVPRDAEKGADLHFDMVVRKIRIVSSEMDTMISTPESIAKAQISLELSGGNSNFKTEDNFSIRIDEFMKRYNAKNIEGNYIESFPQEMLVKFNDQGIAMFGNQKWQNIIKWYGGRAL